MSDIKFFDYTDFELTGMYTSGMPVSQIAAELANAKLRSMGKKVYSYRPELTWFTNTTGRQCEYCGGHEADCCRYYELKEIDTHTGLLIDIQEIQKCTHPTSKVSVLVDGAVRNYKCQCGKLVTPKEFEEI